MKKQKINYKKLYKNENKWRWQYYNLSLVLIIILFIIVGIALYFPFKPTFEYIIYKNEYKNKTNTFDDGDNFLCSDGSHGFLNNTNILHELNASCYIIGGEKEVCNKVEVDEIEYTNEILAVDSECKRNCWDKYSGQWDKEEWNNCDEKCYWSILQDESISKKDITREWLDKMCKCISVCYREDCINEDSENGYVESILRDLKESKCLRYKCFENYEIEIK